MTSNLLELVTGRLTDPQKSYLAPPAVTTCYCCSLSWSRLSWKTLRLCAILEVGNLCVRMWRIYCIIAVWILLLKMRGRRKGSHFNIGSIWIRRSRCNTIIFHRSQFRWGTWVRYRPLLTWISWHLPSASKRSPLRIAAFSTLNKKKSSQR